MAIKEILSIKPSPKILEGSWQVVYVETTQDDLCVTSYLNADGREEAERKFRSEYDKQWGNT